MKKLGNLVERIVAFLCITTIIATLLPTVAIKAATTIGKTSSILCKESDIYWKSVQKYCPDNIGDVTCYELKWKEVSKADGYKIVLSWNSDNGKYKETMNVKKKGSKYSIKIANWSRNTSIYNSGKNCALGKGKPDSITTNKPYCILCTGSCVQLDKVSIQAYRISSGKKIYGKTVTKKL